MIATYHYCLYENRESGGSSPRDGRCEFSGSLRKGITLLQAGLLATFWTPQTDTSPTCTHSPFKYNDRRFKNYGKIDKSVLLCFRVQFCHDRTRSRSLVARPVTDVAVPEDRVQFFFYRLSLPISFGFLNTSVLLNF